MKPKMEFVKCYSKNNDVESILASRKKFRGHTRLVEN
jgi:hypothetical protein